MSWINDLNKDLPNHFNLLNDLNRHFPYHFLDNLHRQLSYDFYFPDYFYGHLSDFLYNNLSQNLDWNLLDHLERNFFDYLDWDLDQNLFRKGFWLLGWLKVFKDIFDWHLDVPNYLLFDLLLNNYLLFNNDLLLYDAFLDYIHRHLNDLSFVCHVLAVILALVTLLIVHHHVVIVHTSVAFPPSLTVNPHISCNHFSVVFLFLSDDVAFLPFVQILFINRLAPNAFAHVFYPHLGLLFHFFLTQKVMNLIVGFRIDSCLSKHIGWI